MEKWAKVEEAIGSTDFVAGNMETIFYHEPEVVAVFRQEEERT